MNQPITLITGTRKGIGNALASYYLEMGHIVVGCSRNEPDWSKNNYIHFTLDVSDEEAVKEMFSAIRNEIGRIDHLINNAGIAAMNHSLLTPLSTVQKIFNTNLMGTFLMCREAAKLMQRQKFGRIVNFSTVAVPLKIEGESIYAASKAAVVSMTEIMSRELGPYGITVNAIGPTPIQTDLIKSVAEKKINDLVDRQAIRRMGSFEDVINVVDFFLKKESSFITGQTIYLGGV